MAYSHSVTLLAAASVLQLCIYAMVPEKPCAACEPCGSGDSLLPHLNAFKLGTAYRVLDATRAIRLGLYASI